jgi:FeS assembly SUF system protein
VSPLARASDSNPAITERFELFITGREYANGFSELNDAEDQAARFQAQAANKDAGDDEVEQLVWEQLRTCFDPEIPVNIYDLGLVYTIEIGKENEVEITMTLTAPGCPVAGEMPGWVANAVEPLPGVKQVDVQMTFDPPWGMEMMSDEARLELGFM